MTTLVWDDVRRYEAGVDSGVFYPIGGVGVPWGGLVSVVESFVGNEVTSYYIDGVQYLTIVGGKNFQAKVSSYAAPTEFAIHNGYRAVVPGFFLAKQPKPRFNFTYRTNIGEGDYKIHLVYNVLATQTSQKHATISDRIPVDTLEWIFDATPVEVPGFKPSAYLVVDSIKVDPEVLSDLEDLLYGTDDDDPTFPTIDALLALFGG